MFDSSTWELRLRDGKLAASRRSGGDADRSGKRRSESRRKRKAAGICVGILWASSESESRSWFILPRNDDLTINATGPLLPLAQLDPGALLAVGRQCWFVTTLWTPEPVDAPEELRDKTCHICRFPLADALVVQCVCGRWTHLERPDKPDDAESLNCYLTAQVCGSCRRQVSLAPQCVPELPEVLREQFEEENAPA